MKILVTGAKGFVGKNLVSNLYNIKEGKNRTRQLQIEDIFEYDMDSTLEELDTYCEHADFVFNSCRCEIAQRISLSLWKETLDLHRYYLIH